MKANEDKHLEEFADKLMNETSLERPSTEFTSKVMSQVLAADKSTATLYKPLISKKVWFIIFAAIIALMGYLIINVDAQADSWLDQINFNEINNDIIKNYAGFKFSDITVYAVVLLTAMLFMQIIFLKSHFNKRVEK
jgi:hypothetical protein